MNCVPRLSKKSTFIKPLSKINFPYYGLHKRGQLFFQELL